ncbi:MAG TPA: aspartyl protease family protein, partial [Candidatus Limnocylindria bacterium]|nr:aspartyl protease family protein [Candidatus Limnocylindria bacterium]
MKRALIFVMGVFAGQWLVFGSVSSPAALHVKAQVAYEHRDYVEAMRLWSQAVSLQPDNAAFHYSRATALARLGLRLSAADAYQMSLLLDPSHDLARQAMEGLASLSPPAVSADVPPRDVTVPLESGLGVWITTVTVNASHRGRFLVDTGSSVIVLSPAFARAVGARSSGAADIELQTLSGRTSGA